MYRRADPSWRLASPDTFASHLQAVRRRHSTTEEALEVAASSGAYRTILTHFSQRYPKIPAGIPAPGGSAAHDAVCADDVPIWCLSNTAGSFHTRTQALRRVSYAADQGSPSMQSLRLLRRHRT